MNKLPIVRIIAAVIFFYSLFVVVGWIFDIAYFTNIQETRVNMKFATACCFLLSGIGLWFIDLALRGKGDISQVVLPATTTLSLLIMATLFIAGFLQVSTGIDDLFIRNSESYKLLSSGMPSIATILNFVLFGIASLLALFPAPHVNKTITKLSFPIGLIGVIAIIIVNSPVLYSIFSKSFTPMPLNTAILFIVLSIGLWQTGRQKLPNEN